MKLINKSKQFDLKFDGIDYVIPEGEFEVVNERLANHIIAKSVRWEKDVKIIPNTIIDAIKPIDKKEKIEEIIVESTPAFGGATTDTLPKKQGRPKKDA